MAKKFVKVNGLHNVFEVSANITSSTIKSGASASVDANSILFITADAADVTLFGSDYPSMKEGAHYIWAQGVLHDTNSGIMDAKSGSDWIDVDVTGKTATVSHSESDVVSGEYGMVGASSVKAGGTIVVKIPNFAVDKYGHLTAAASKDLTIGIPIESHTDANHKNLSIKCGGSSYAYDALTEKTIDVDGAIAKKIAPFENAMHFVGKAAVDLADGSTAPAGQLGITGYTTTSKGDIVLDKSGIHEYIWTGSAWEQIGYLVGATAANVTGSTYEIGTIKVEGKTTTFVGKDTVTAVSYADTSKSGPTYEIGKITINGTTTTLIGKDNDTIYGSTGGVELEGTSFKASLHTWGKLGATGVATTDNNRTYQVRLDAAGKLAVNVPWTDTNTAHAHAAGDGIVLTGDTNGGTGTSTTTIGVTAATTAKYGGIKIGYSATGKNYPVQLNSNGQAFVNVPWTDTNSNTTYSLSGAVVGTTGSAATNSSVTTAVASAVSFKDTLTPSSGNASTSTCILMNGDGVINLKAVSGKNNAIEIDYTGVATAEDWATIG